MQNKRGDLSFTVGLMLCILMFFAILTSCTNIYKEATSSQPSDRFGTFVGALKNIDSKPVGSGNTILAYLGNSYALIGFTKTADAVKKISATKTGNMLSMNTMLYANRPVECPYGTACVCLVSDLFTEQPDEAPPIFFFKWEKTISCKKLDVELMNLQLVGEEELFKNSYWKGGFIITRHENVRYKPMTAGGYVGFFNIPEEPELYLNKNEHGVGVCFKAPCTMRGMSEHQQQYVTALEVYKRANEAYEQGEYFTAEQLFTELLEMEEVQRGHGFPGGSVKIQVGDDKRLEGTEFVLNRREHDKAYFLKAMSLVKQQKYQEAVTSFKQAKERTTLEDVKSAITNTLEGLDCTKRSFALCNKKEPSEFCYRDSQESSCKQCSEQTNCGVFDSQMACTQYSCGRRCVWNEGACSDTPPQRGAV